MKKFEIKKSLRGEGKRREARDIVRGAKKAAKFLKEARTIRRKDDKFEIEAIYRHSEGNNNFIPKNLMTSNQLDLSLIAKDDENIFSETDHASTPLGIFASKTVFRKTNLGGVGTPPYVAGERILTSGTCSFGFEYYPISTSPAWKFLYNKGLEPSKFEWDGTLNALYNDMERGCAHYGQSNGAYCTALIQSNGWKIPKDYPRKVRY